MFMALSQIIWSLDEKKPLDSAALTEEKELENLLCNNIEILNRDWLVVKNQVKTAAGKYIDILCMDHDGDMVVIELKKDQTPREVTAQVIDYAASVSKMNAQDIAQLYLDFSRGNETLNSAYKQKFSTELDEDSVNQKVKMIIVASKMDDGTERIIRFLRDTYGVDINILFFQVFQCGNQRLISRAWFEDDIEASVPTTAPQRSTWNGEYYISFGDGDDGRNWEDARKYGFISAGGGSWYSRTLNMLSPGDRVWVNIPHVGYVGVGKVTDIAKQAKDATFNIEGEEKAMSGLPLMGKYFNINDNEEQAEYIVKVCWINTVEKAKAVSELGFFGNQNSVCRPSAERWDFTVSRLKKIWNIADE